MKSYHVYRHPTLGYLEIIKIGFSWPAMLITLPWMLVKRLWVHAVLTGSFTFFITGYRAAFGHLREKMGRSGDAHAQFSIAAKSVGVDVERIRKLGKTVVNRK